MLSPYGTNDLVRASNTKDGTNTIVDSKKGSENVIANTQEAIKGQNASHENNHVSPTTTTTTNTLSIVSSDDKMANRIYSPNSLLSMQDAPMKPAPQVIQSDDGDAIIAL